MLEKQVKSAVLAKISVKKYASDGSAFFNFFKRLPKSLSYRLSDFKALHLLMIRLLASFKRLALSAEKRHCLIS
jgi:hypothetical protein